jgi:hypothetical protein
VLLDLVAEISRLFRLDKVCVQVGYINDVLQNPNNLSNGQENSFSDFPLDRLSLLIHKIHINNVSLTSQAHSADTGRDAGPTPLSARECCGDGIDQQHQDE